MRPLVRVMLVLMGASAAGCELIAGLQDRELCDGSCTDGGGDVTTDAPKPGFSLAINPSSIVLEPGASGPVGLTITRTGGFNEALDISLQSAPTGVTASTTIPVNGASGTLSVAADSTAVSGKATLVSVVATSTPSGLTSIQPLNVRIGHLLIAADSTTTYAVPSDVQQIIITMWGAGGGGGDHPALSVFYPGAPGGGGGFAQGTFNVVPGSTLTLIVGTGGSANGPGATSNYGAGGGGGGYSAAVLADLIGDAGADATITLDASAEAGEGGLPILAVVGGGGGGGGGLDQSPYFGNGKPGGAGSGDDGAAGVGAIGTSGGGGGTSTAGGAGGTGCPFSTAAGGGFLLGGVGVNYATPGGVPGGGAGGSGAGGGGGGGWFGGGSGAIGVQGCLGGSGGGGGSGYIAPGAINVTTMAGSGPTPPNTNNPLYVTDAGIIGVGGSSSVPGSGGRIVLTVP